MSSLIHWSGYGREQRPPLEALDIPVAHFDLEREIERLQAEEAWRDSGHNGKTLTKHAHLRVVLSVLKAGHRIPDHRLPGAATIQLVSGRAIMHCGRRRLDLVPGQVVLLGAAVHVDVCAVSDCGFLLTFER